jgi:two-component system, CAI-1 autoinducer sensor kinase/phosphatase CqsS
VALALEQDFSFLGSRAQFSQVLVNLIKNALHALAASAEAPRPGDLRISVTLRDDRGQIEITDKGTGIPLKKQHRIFEPFFSLQSTVGNGLGLTFCKNVVEASDGRLLLRSHPGQGASFTIDLPLRDQRAPPVPPTSFN